MNDLDFEKLEAEWLALFPDGKFIVHKHCLGDTKFIRLFVNSVWSGGIPENDALNQAIHLFEDEIDSGGSILIKPQEKFLAFSSHKTGWRNFKPVSDVKTQARLIKYFHKVHKLVVGLKNQNLMAHEVKTK